MVVELRPPGGHAESLLSGALPPGLRRLTQPADRSRIGTLRFRCAKRALDIGGSLALILLTLPVIVAAALAVRLTSRGPAFYTQDRVGRHGRPFKIFKLRTMVIDADQRLGEMAALVEDHVVETADAPAFKSVADPRVTRVGRFLRRSSLDELPQLFNVLAGQMSLVGPRPLVEVEYRSLSPEQAARRNKVNPGLTCLWQVVRSEDTTFSERVDLDLAYVDSASAALDVALVLMTPHAVLSGHGCY